MAIMGAIGAVVGAVVLIRRGSGGSAVVSTGAEASGGDIGSTSGGGVGYLDTTATDLASLLGQTEVDIQNILAENRAQLEELTAGLSQGTTPEGWSARLVSVDKISISDLLKKYGISGEEFRKANPQYYSGRPAGYQQKVLKKGQTVVLPTGPVGSS